MQSACGGGYRMIQLFIKESSSNNQRMTVRDDRGQIIYVIEGRWGRKNDVTSIYELNGDLIMSVKQTKSAPLPVFQLYTKDKDIASMRKHPGLFGIRDSYFTIHPLNWTVTGDFEDLYFTIQDNNQELIMECEKDIYNTYTVYELLIDEGVNPAACALLATLFDPHSRNKSEDEQRSEFIESDYDFGFNAFTLQKSKPKMQTKCLK